MNPRLGKAIVKILNAFGIPAIYWTRNTIDSLSTPMSAYKCRPYFPQTKHKNKR